MPPTFLWDAQVHQGPPPPGTAEGGYQAAQVWGRRPALKSQTVQTQLSHILPGPPGQYLFFQREKRSLFDLLLVSRRPGQKVRGMDSIQAALPGYCVTLAGCHPSLNLCFLICLWG